MDKPKVALLSICLNPPYWDFAKQLYDSVDSFFLKDCEVTKLLWTDMPEEVSYGATRFEIEPVEWPYPTLLRYHLFLREEEELRKYDYLLYLDIDMLVVSEVGKDVLGEGLTIARHPMYALRKEFIPPFEPNVESQAYIPRPGRVLLGDGKIPYFDPVYAAGGFQGGKTEIFIKAMKEMKRAIDKDLEKGYIARWNDESHWNKYLFDHPEEVQRGVVLSPSYVYPDSLIDLYYKKLWGTSYEPKIVTLTKKFTTTKEGGDAIKDTLLTL
jgi:histo-blood group ABO system transferase